ncbi:hypothetical protein [Hoylesella saccharolytica]|uniref:hypothetical protein n=1 Tax=Hoylesella saccharolytica TaxID=633701 RepID=UPI001F29697B|nr:hypothetical protein [Hoylesella saccharolytica]
MKRILFILILLCGWGVSLSAQEIYQEIMRLSKKVAEDKSKDLETRKVATFKVDELKYMAMKTRELMPDSTVRVLDVQAYAMYDFVNLFLRRLGEAKKKSAKEAVIARFRAAQLITVGLMIWTTTLC